MFGLVGANLAERVRILFMRAVLYMEIGWFDQDANTSGNLASRLAADAPTVRGAVGDTLGIVVQNCVALVTGCAIAFANGWKMTLVVLAVLPLLGFATFVQTAVMTGAPQMPTVFGGLQKVSGVYKVAVQRCCRLAVPILVLVPLKCHLHTQTHTHTPVSVRRLCRRVCDASSVTHLAVTAGQSGISDDAFGHAGDTANEAVQALRTVHSYNLQSRVAASYAALVAVPVRRMCRAGLAAGFVFGLSQCILFLFFALAFWCGSRARRSVAELLGSRSTS